jgi:hypothetical protein
MLTIRTTFAKFHSQSPIIFIAGLFPATLTHGEVAAYNTPTAKTAAIWGGIPPAMCLLCDEFRAFHSVTAHLCF